MDETSEWAEEDRYYSYVKAKVSYEIKRHWYPNAVQRGAIEKYWRNNIPVEEVIENFITANRIMEQ